MISVELIDLFAINTSLINVDLIHDIEDCGNTSTLKSLNIHFIKWIWSHEKIWISDSLEEEIVQEIAIGFVQPSIDNPAFAGLSVEPVLRSAHLTSIIVRIFNGNISIWISLGDKSIVVSFYNKSVLELLIRSIQESTDIWGLLLHHFKCDLYWLHCLAVFNIHPIDIIWNLANLELRCFVVLKYPFFLHVLNWMPDGEAHLILLPNIVIVNDLDSRDRWSIVDLVDFTSSRSLRLSSKLQWFLILNVGH